MTYNFDPDQWLEIQKAQLDNKLKEGTINRQEYDAALEQAEERYHRMWKYLDGTCKIEEQQKGE
jgi:hypothetical protein